MTMDKLKRFNDINGYEHGPATRPIVTEEDQEELDKVHDMHTQSNLSFKQLPADNKSVLSRILSKRSEGGKSAKSSLSKVFMRNLQKELDEERRAREKLEREIAEIRKINTDLSTTLGLLAK